MRKNNFLKIFVSLVMCLTLVLSLVACGGTDGKDGKDGVDGKDGADGVGIAGVTYEDGKLVINYTNDETDSFDIVAEAAACEHNYSEPVELVKHTIDAKGTYLTVCGECGAAALNADTIHNFETTEVAATCTAYGYTADKCVCGYETNKVMGTELAAHNMTTKGYVAIEGKTICVDGGTLLQYCTECKLTAQTETEGIGHKVVEYAIEKGNEPTISRTGLLTGKCAQCNADVEEVLPVLSADDYAVEVLVAKVDCGDVGEANYTYSFNGQTFVIKGDIAAADHVLAGKPASELAWIIDGVEVYDVNIAGIKLMAGQELACETVMPAAYYMCEECNVAVAVSAYRCHAGAVSENSTPVAATCETTGSQLITKCTYCAKDNVTATIPATGHHYAYDVKTVEVNGKTVVTEINKTCDNKCGSVLPVLFVEGEASYKELVAATCVENGEAEITYKPLVFTCTKTEHSHKACNLSCTLEAHTHGGAECYTAKKAITVKVDTSLANHKLNGVFVNAALNQDSNIAGIKLFAGETLTNCEDVADGYFMCETCAEAVAVKVEKKHAVLTWTWAKDAQGNEIKPTCSTNGILEGKCSVETCGKVILDDKSDKVQATGKHEIKYTFVPVAGTEDSYTMTYDCAGCDDPKYNDAEGTVVTGVKTTTVKSTCSVQGTITYSYKLDGKTVTAVEKLDLAAHTLNGEAVKTTVLDYDLVPGLKLFAGANLVCGASEDGYFFCEACDEAVSVTVVKNHRGSWTWTEKDADGNFIVPTCDNGANRVMAECLDCGAKNIADFVPALTHVPAVKFNTYIFTTADNVQKIAGTAIAYCTLCDEELDTIDVTKVLEISSLTIKDAKNVVKATCKVDGSATFVVEIADVEYTFAATIYAFDCTTQAALKSTSNIFVLSRTTEDGEVEYYAVYECATCGDFYVLENTADFDFDSADKADVEKAIADFKAELKKAEDEKAAADAQ